MFGAIFRPLVASRRRRAALIGVAAVAIAAAVWLGRGAVVAQKATAQSALPTPPGAASVPAAPAPGEDLGSDYATRVVAFVHHSQPITRQDLGEYLIARYGADKLPLLVNKRILDQACRESGIVVTAVEVENALAEELKGLAVDRATFMKTVLTRYKKNLYEFQEDVLRPRLQLTRLCQPTITVTPDDLKMAYESAYGEKVECRIIVWPFAQEGKDLPANQAKVKTAMESFAALRDADEKAFIEAAKKQEDSSLASTGGLIKPISHWSGDEEIEKAAFELKPGQVSTLITTKQGVVLLRCVRRIPADTNVNFASAKPKLEMEIREAKMQLAMGNVFKDWRDRANPTLYLKKADKADHAPTPPPTQAVATVFGASVTREDLGEFLIARIGGEKLPFLVNRRILELACKQANVTVSDEEVEAELQEPLKMTNTEPRIFEKELLLKVNKNLYEWREDVLRPKLLLAKLAGPRITISEEDVKKCFEAYYGERLKCRMILWPAEYEREAWRTYPLIRDSAEEFEKAARAQPSPTLNAQAGELPVFGRHALGDENLEREAFRLQPGEVSPLIGTAQGKVVLKCVERIPPDKTRTLEQSRAELMREIKKKKTEIEAKVLFDELSQRAAPRLLLAGTGQPEDLAAQTKKLTSDLPRR